jgi:hypothetical protein
MILKGASGYKVGYQPKGDTFRLSTHTHPQLSAFSTDGELVSTSGKQRPCAAYQSSQSYSTGTWPECQRLAMTIGDTALTHIDGLILSHGTVNRARLAR